MGIRQQLLNFAFFMFNNLMYLSLKYTITMNTKNSL